MRAQQQIPSDLTDSVHIQSHLYCLCMNSNYLGSGNHGSSARHQAQQASDGISVGVSFHHTGDSGYPIS